MSLWSLCLMFRDCLSPSTSDDENMPPLWNMGHRLHIDTADCFTLHYVLSPQKLQILDIQHSTLGYNVQLKHWNLRAFSNQSLATNSGPMVRIKFRHPQWPSNANSQRRNQPIQLPLQCSHQCTPQWTHRLIHRTANPKAPASILAPRPACQILTTCINCSSCL
jgi:hypothetical protein